MILNQVTIPCLDYDRSVAFYKSLGFVQIVDSPPNYARFETPSGEGATFSLHTVDRTASTDVVIYFDFSSAVELDNKVDALQKQGFEFTLLPTNQPWLWREARLKDPAGNILCMMYAGTNRRFPPWRIEG